VGFIYPAYASYKALEVAQLDEVAQWLTYWVVFSLFAAVEGIVDRLVYWLPFYYIFKLAFILWLQLPQFRGASKLFKGAVKPLLKKHEAEIDRQIDTGLQKAMSLSSNGLQMVGWKAGAGPALRARRPSQNLDRLPGDTP